MNSEFLMPVKYEGAGCGISISLFGMDNEAQYTDIYIYIEGLEDNKQQVYIDESNNFRTTSATFEGLKENQFYTIIAEFYCNANSVTTKTKIVPDIAKNQSQIMSLSLDLANVPAKKYYGGAMSQSTVKCTMTAINEVK